MSHQINFYLHPKDEEAIEEKIRSRGPLAILHDRSSRNEPHVVPSVQVEENGEPRLFLFLAREEDVSKLVLTHVPEQSYWTIDVLRSPVIELIRSSFDGKVLRRGRIYYVDGYYGPDDAWVEKDAAFKAWAKAVFSAVKKVLVRHGSNYAGPEARAWIESSESGHEQ